MAEFSVNEKSSLSYLDYAANGNGAEKAAFFIEAISRASEAHRTIHALEVGPGGGAALNAVADSVEKTNLLENSELHISLLEMDGVESDSLKQARKNIGKFATTSLHKGNLEHMSDNFENQLDVIGASAVMHEVYSYGNGYHSLDDAIGAITKSLKPNGYFAYRDVFSVDRLSQHERARHLYDKESWITFIKEFLPYYLNNATHPYHRQDDRFIFEQDSRRIDLDGIDESKILSVDAPVGLLREIQRHYITMRDHVWRSGILGFTPTLEGAEANDWIDLNRGHKRVHFAESPKESPNPILAHMSEAGPNSKWTIDGDIFDSITDHLLARFLHVTSKEAGSEAEKIWQEWLKREGSETYTYMTLNTLLGSVALQSFIESDAKKILLPVNESDVRFTPRSYYNRYLSARLSNPLVDGKQLILFQAVDIKNPNKDESRNKAIDALGVIKQHCSRETIASIAAPLSKLF